MALVITIIIMIILATVAINYLFGENGLITKAQQAAEMSNIENVREKLEMAKGTAAIDGKGNIDPDHYFDILEEEGIIGDKETDVIDNGNGTYEVTTVEGYIFIITIVTTPEGKTDLEIEYSGTADGPRIVSIKAEGTTNSINIEVDARNADGATYTYRYKLTNEEEWKEAEQSKNNTCTINNLVDGETYDIEVTVETSEGSVTRGTSVHLGELPEGTITFETEWVGDETARVTINTSAEGYQLQYQTNAVEENGWTNIDSGYTISNLTYPSTVYARIFDGKNGSEHASETLEDKTVPSVTVTPNGTTSNSVSVTAVATDAESGMKDSLTYTYSIKVTGTDDNTYTTPSGASNIASNSYTFTGLTQGTNYTVRVQVNGDKADNVGTGTLADQTTGSIPSGEGDGELEEGAITFGETTWSNNKASVTVNTSETGYKIEYQVNTVTEGKWTEISNGGEIDNLNYQDTVYARLTDGTNHGDYASASIEDKIAPSVTVSGKGTTSNSVSVSASASDAQSGMKDSLTYTYSIKVTGTDDNTYTTPSGASNIASNSYTFTGLTQGTNYTVRVEVNGDKANNVGTGTLANQTTGSIPSGAGDGELEEGAITFGETTWSNNKASVTVNTSETGYKIEYQVNTLTEGKWKEIANGGEIDNLNYQDTVYARLTDGNNHGEYASHSVDDQIAPTVTVSPAGTTSNSVSVTASATDAQSGMKDSLTYTYSIKVTGQDDSTYTTPSGASNINSNTYTFTGLTQGTNYTVRVQVNGDKANNVGTGTLENQTTGSIPGGEGDGELEEGAITFGETTWSNNKASVTVNTSETGYKIEYQVNTLTEGKWKEIANGGEIDNLNYQDTVYARLTDGNNHGEYASHSVDDQIAPTVTVSPAGTTSNSVSVTAVATDAESGMKDSLTYTYSIKVTGQADSTYTTPSNAQNIASNSYTFTELIQGTNYTVRVQVNGDKAGNTGTGTLTNQTTGTVTSGLVTGAITFTRPSWTSSGASVVVNTNTTYKIEYQVNTLTEGNWTEIANGGTISELKDRDIVYARLTDGINTGDYASIEVEDNTVARIGDIYYYTLQDAINAVQSNVETNVVLVRDTLETVAISNNKKIVLNLNNNTLSNNTNAYIINVNSGSNLTVTGSGTIKFNGVAIYNYGMTTITGEVIISATSHAIYNEEGATLEVSETANISNKNNLGNYATIYNLGKATITGGMITSADTRAIVNREGATLEVSGTANISSTANESVAINNYGTATIKGGAIEGKYGINNVSSMLTVTGGMITGTTNGIYNKGTTTVTGGTITGTNSSAIHNEGALEVSGTANISTPSDINFAAINNYGTATIKGGAIEGKYGINNVSSMLTVTGGTITGTNSSAIHNNKGTANITGGTITGTNSGAIVNTEGATLEVSGTANISSTSPSDKNYPAINNYGTATIKGGTIKGSTGIYNVNVSSILTVTEGTITGTNGYGIYNLGKATITGGNISSRYNC